jgi:hypothetical protein
MAAPTFFVPGVAPDKAEEVFEALAKFAGSNVPQLDERVYLIEFIHDGERWTAEVGQRLHGKRIPNVGRKRQRKSAGYVSDPAKVLAIFASVPWLVVIDTPPLGTSRSAWHNPLMAGNDPTRVEYFSPSGENG